MNLRSLAERVMQFARRRRRESLDTRTRKTSVVALPVPDVFHRDTDVSLLVGDNVVVHKTGPSGEVVRLDEWGTAEISSDETPGGTVRSRTRAIPKQGEDDTHEVCKVLVRRLNQDGSRWSSPERIIGGSDADCIARQGDAVLEIQVKRVAEESFWKRLRRGTVERDETIADMVNALRVQIAASARKYPPSRRKRLTLALNARQTPQYAFQSTVQSFRANHGEWARGLGFAGIWVVGPTHDFAQRLES